MFNIKAVLDIVCTTRRSLKLGFRILAFNMQVMSMTCRKTSDAVKAIIIMLSCIVNFQKFTIQDNIIHDDLLK